MKRWVVALCVVVSACSDRDPGAPSTGGCTSNDQCEGGAVCAGGACKPLCSSDAQCPSGQICVESLCEAGSRTTLPQITAVDGDSANTCAAANDTHCLLAGLVVTGVHLDGATFRLTPASGAAHVLVSRAGATDSRVELDLPDIGPGGYLLTATNAVGSDQAELTLLQGEPGEQGPAGPPGSDADLTGTQIVARLNGDAGAGVISVARLPPFVAPDDPRLIAAARSATIRVTAGSTRGIEINGTPLAVPATNGVQLVVIDAATHAVRTETSLTGPPYFHNFPMAQALDGQNLASVIAELDAGDIVILASRGSAFTYISTWASAAVSLGASRGVAALGAGDTYILIGRPGLGVGAGLEAIADEAAGGARLLARLADDDLVSRSDPPRRNYVYSQGSGTAATTCVRASTSGFSAWTALPDLPSRTLTTSGGPVRFDVNMWVYAITDTQIEARVVLNGGTASEQALGSCGRVRASLDASLHSTLACSFVSPLAAGTYTIAVQFRCDDAGTDAATDANIFCDTAEACSLFAEEL